MVAFPISHRVLRKIFFCGIILALTGARVGGIGDEEIETAVKVATVSLQREMTSLKEQLEIFEMKHETLHAAAEQFRMQSKTAKTKLEEERTRYNTLASEKQTLETSMESKLEEALEEQKTTFEEEVAVELIEKRNRLAKENEELVQKLRRSEYELSVLEGDWKEKLDHESKRHERSEGKRRASEEKLRKETADLKKRLSFSEQQAKSFEEAWKDAVAESEAKDEQFQTESGKRLQEASRWEKRLQKLNEESKDLYEDNKAKEIELVRAKKLHLTLLEKLSESDEAVREHEAKIVQFTADIEKMSNELTSTSGELSQAKKEHTVLAKRFENLSNLHEDTELVLQNTRAEGERNARRNKELQNDLVDLKFDLESSQKKTKQTIEEKAEMTKSFTEALEQLTSKNTFLRHELVDMKFELEESQSETTALRSETEEITIAHHQALKRLQDEGKTLKLLRKEYLSLEKEFKTITDQFKESEEKVKQYQNRIKEEAAVNAELQNEVNYAELKVENSQKIEKKLSAENKELLKMYEDIKKTMGSSEKKLLETMQQHEKSEAHVQKLLGSVQKLEEKVEELTEELDMKVEKNSYLQKSLLDAKFALEESKNKVKLLEGRVTERSAVGQDVGALEFEKKKMIERSQELELELQESTSSYNVASRKIDDLREQLNATETRSAQILNMYELVKEENHALNRNLRESEGRKSEFQSVNLELQKKDQSFQQCGKALDETKEEVSKLKREYAAAMEDLKVRQSDVQVKSQIQTEGVENDTTYFEETSEEKSENKSQEKSFSFFRWLDYSLYTILRVVVDLIGFLANGIWQALSSATFFSRLIAPFKSFFVIASWTFNEFRIVHNALVSLFEFEMTFISSLVSSEKDRTIFDFLIRHSETFVMFGEAIAMLLSVDFVISSFLYPIKQRKRRPQAKSIHVPKSAHASLLRKANNL
uniref:Uncharacterized protein n=1 Tax=Pseudo-nitzschia delicatissima TaxID=44447 RepID=A0A7S0XKZ1_9STRA|mmetsp:Transcript_1374/g.3174  ORF Transcript_1374/g.3174 Transcript_1374/m.3174 type:complete len:940 (+) Transcript_1374:78-2897(+)